MLAREIIVLTLLIFIWRVNSQNCLYDGNSMPSSSGLFSKSGSYELVFQSTDGNLCVYPYPRAGNTPSRWCNMVTSSSGGGQLGVVGGNLVTYTPSGAGIWASSTSGSSYVIMQDDGNLVLYGPTGNFIWGCMNYKNTAFPNGCPVGTCTNCGVCTNIPTMAPTLTPTLSPTLQPTRQPTCAPTRQPTDHMKRCYTLVLKVLSMY